MSPEEDEFQPQDDEENSSLDDEIAARRAALFAAFEEDLEDFAGKFMSRNRAHDDSLPLPAKPVFDVRESTFPETKFVKSDPDTQAVMIQKSSGECPSANLVCDSVSASKSKCGFDEFHGFVSSPPKLYLTSTLHRVGSSNFASESPPGYHCHAEFDETKVITLDPNDDCSATVECSGGGSRTADDAAGDNGALGNDFTITYVLSGSDCAETPRFYAGCDPGVDCSEGTGPNTTVTTSTTQTISCTLAGTSRTLTTTLSDEYTTALLKSNAIAALPAFSGLFECVDPCDPEDPVPPCFEVGQGCSCDAVYNLSEDETSFTLQRFKYKFLLSSPSCDGMVLSWNEHFQPTSGAPTNTTRSVGFGDGATESTVFTCPDPTDNGTTTITNINVDCSACTGVTSQPPFFAEVDD